MKQLPLDKCYFVFAFLNIIFNKAISSTPMFSSGLIQLGIDTCKHHVNFCTNEKQITSSRTCCSECSCWSSCYEKRECCPDIANSTFRYKHSCHSVYYKNPEYWRRQTELPERSYEMVTVCLDGTDCSVDFSQLGGEVHLDDVVVVNTEPDLVIFKNKRCAECNGVYNYTKWRLVASDCMFRDKVAVNMSGTEMFKHMLTNCILYSFPEKTMVQEFYPQTCESNYPDNMITRCNVTGRWDFVDDIIFEACTDKYLHSPVYHPFTKESYKNVYCFICNNKEGEQIPPRCFQFIKDRFTSEFVEIMDLQNDFSSLPETGTRSERCEDNEVFDEMFDRCRAILCPRLNFFSNGICKNPPFIVSSAYIYIFNVMLFPVEVIPSNMPLGDTDFENLLENILDVTDTRDLCEEFYLYSAIANYHRNTSTLHYLIVEINVIIGYNINCTLDRLANSLQILTYDIKLSIIIPIGPERKETINMTLAPDNRTQILGSRQRLTPHNKTHFSEIVFESGKLPVTNTVIETPFVCPHVSLDEAEYSRLVFEFHEGDPTNKHHVVVRTFVNSYNDYLDDQIFRTFSMCLDQYKLIGLKLKADPVTVMGTLSLALSCISMICSMVIFLLFCFTKRLNNGPMVLFACALVNLFIAQGVFQFGSGWNDKPVLCQTIGIAVHYFWLASVFALNAYCVLILRQIMSVKTQMCNTDLIVSLFYVYGVPACFVLVNIIYTNTDTSSSTGSGYGAGQCHINMALMRGLLFALPIFLTVIFNFVVNCVIAIKIKRTQSTVNSTRKESKYAIVFFRLLIVAGLTWIFGILKEFVTSSVLDYCFVVFITGQGIFLLFSFVCRKHFFQELRKEYQMRKSSRVLSGTTSNASEIYKQGTQDTD